MEVLRAAVDYFHCDMEDIAAEVVDDDSQLEEVKKNCIARLLSGCMSYSDSCLHRRSSDDDRWFVVQRESSDDNHRLCFH